tara:strand:- start:1610 stop:1912 length:303 start_codon:yes stop_codon:yes gene_type:complete
MKRLFSHDEATGITKFWHVLGNGEYVVETVQRAEAIVDANKRAFNDAEERWGEKLNRVASIPLSVYYDLKRKGIADDPARMKNWMNDPDNRAFRTRGGTL